MDFNEEEKKMIALAQRLRTLVLSNSKEQVKRALREVLREAQLSLSPEELAAARTWPASLWADEKALRTASKGLSVTFSESEAILNLRRAWAELATVRRFI